MAVFLSDLTITPSSIVITPDFNSSTFEYNVDKTNVANITINAYTELSNKIGIIREEDGESWISENSGNFSQEIQLLGGKNTFYISVQSSIDAPPIEFQTYKLQIFFSSGPTTWPIYSNYLKPGFYGGSFVPNYRLLKEIYTCGSGDKDFEGDYSLKSQLNENAIKFLDEVISLYTRVGKLDAIVESFIHYSGFVNTNWPDDGDYRYYLPLIEVGVERPDHMRNSYKPKNNKLLSYPYSALKIIGYGGESELKYELFPEDVHFGIISKFFAGASIQLYPVNYEGILDAYGDGVTGQPLPVFPYTKDQYMNEWNANINTRNDTILAMNENKNLKQVATIFSGISGLANTALTTSGLSKVGTTEGGANKGALISGAIQGVTKAAETGISMYANKLEYNQGLRAMAAQLKDTEARPSSVANQNASPSIPAVMKDAVVPFVQRVSIREVFAKKIDDFFSRYGYAVNRVGVPNIKSRPAFNFLRCNEAHVDGNIPNEDLLEIKAVLEHGVTFWHNHDVGNYNLENPAPITNNPRYCQPVG